MRSRIEVLGSTLAFSVAVAACAGHATSTRPAPPPAPRAQAPASAEPTASREQDILDDLAFLATRSSPTGEVLARRNAVLERKISLEEYVDFLLSTPAFRQATAPRLVAHQWASRARTFLVELGEETTPDGEKVFTLPGRKKCDAKSIETVHPWWDLESTVKVCADAHRPKHRQMANGWYCNSRQAPLEMPTRDSAEFCGCGPNLVNCAPRAVNARVAESLRNEVERTVGYVVESGRPTEDVFTMNESVRDDYVEAMYQRWRLVSGELPSATLSKLSTEPSLRPRHESVRGQHAGLLTMYPALFPDAPRARMRDLYQILWCTPRQSVRVTTEEVLGLGATNLREGEGWKKLASMNVCTDCHARLDYGMQFFSGYPSQYIGHTLFDAKQQRKGKGPLYNANFQDYLGEAELNAREFAKLATKQPAFGQCMVENVSKHVFAGSASEEDTAAMKAAYAPNHRLAEVMRVALLRYAKSAPAHDGGVTTAKASGPSSQPASALRAQLEEACGDCHSQGAKGFLAQKELSRESMIEMLERVGFGTMPPNEPLVGPRRDAIMNGLASALFQEPSTRSQVLAHYNSTPAHVREPEAVRNLLHSRAGTPTGEPEARRWTEFVAYFQDQNEATYTPEFAVAVAFEAVKECKVAGGPPEKVAACVDKAILANAIISGHALKK